MEKRLVDKNTLSQIIRSIIDCCYTHCKPDRFYRCSRGGIPEDCPIWQGLESVPEKELTGKELLEKIGCEFYSGAKFLCMDAGNKQIYEAIVDHVEFYAVVTDKLSQNKAVNFCMIYYPHRYDGKYGELVWTSDDSIRANSEKYRKLLTDKKGVESGD